VSRASDVKRAFASTGNPIPLPAAKTRAAVEADSKKGDSYKPLSKQFRRDGFQYRQITRQGDAAIYEQRWNGCPDPAVCFEIVRVKRREGFVVDGRFVLPAEVYPRSERWGELGWTFCGDKDAAFGKLRELSRRPSRNQEGMGVRAMKRRRDNHPQLAATYRKALHVRREKEKARKEVGR
jgi:hypothetical protein